MAKTLIRIVTLALPYMAFVFGLSVLPSIALADDKLILAQKVELKNVDGNSTWVGVGKGPFTDSFPNGIDATGNVAAQAPGKPARGQTSLREESRPVPSPRGSSARLAPARAQLSRIMPARM
jgi:hypothetical protein